jgi:hypothetical protein
MIYRRAPFGAFAHTPRAGERDDMAESKKILAEIDRIEDNKTAVLLVGDDDGGGRKTQLDVPLALLPEGAGDGDHLRITISLDRESKDETAGRVKKLQDRLSQAGGAEGKKEFKL